MLQAWLIYNKEGSNINHSYISWFIEEANKKSIDMKLIIRENLAIGVRNNQRVLLLNGKEVTPPDIAVVRTIDPLLSSHLEDMGICVFNSATVARICNHKGLTHHEVQKLAIPMMDTYFYTLETLPKLPPLPFPFVVKNVQGKGGKEVFFITDEVDWIDKRSNFSQEIIIQTTDVQIGKDLRVYVLGKKIIAAVLRESKNDYRANYTLGGNISLYTLNDRERELIERIYHHFDFDLVGIDFLIGKSGDLLFNEIEDIVGSRMLSKLTDINLLEKYTEHILEKWKKQNP